MKEKQLRVYREIVGLEKELREQFQRRILNAFLKGATGEQLKRFFDGELHESVSLIKGRVCDVYGNVSNRGAGAFLKITLLRHQRLCERYYLHIQACV